MANLKKTELTMLNLLRTGLRFIIKPTSESESGQNSINLVRSDYTENARGAFPSKPQRREDYAKNQESLFPLALLYLLLPSAFVLIYFGSWPNMVAIAVGLAILWDIKQAKISVKSLLLLFLNTWPWLALVAGVVWLSGALPPFSENADWYKHYAIFNTLINSKWPPKLVTVDGIATLRYSLSYYIFPSMVAKYLGPWALSSAIYIWTVLGLYMSMVLAFDSKARPVSVLFLLGSVLLLFSGADIIGTYYTGISQGPLMHFEWWWKPFGALDSTITNLFWAPQHAVAGLLATFLVLQYPRRSVQNAGVIIAAVSVWSPFAAIGLIPMFLWATFESGYKAYLTRINLIAAPVLLTSAAFFLTKGSEGIPAGFIWSIQNFKIDGWLIFVLLEFGAIAIALIIVTPQKAQFIALQAVFLIALSLFSVGSANDLLMRASIPSLAVLAMLSSTAVAYAPNTIRKAPLIICLVAGLVTPFGEIMRSLISPRILHSDKITIQDITRGNKNFESQYLIYRDSDNLIQTDSVLTISNLNFSKFGVARFDKKIDRVDSNVFTDAGLVSNDIILPAGIYKLDAVFDWDVTAKNRSSNGGHLSLHGERLLIPIMESKEFNKYVSAYFQTDGKPFKISFGLGGWSTGKGFVELRQLKIGLVKNAGN